MGVKRLKSFDSFTPILSPLKGEGTILFVDLFRASLVLDR